MRDVLVNIKVGGHICEIQIHMASILKEKPNMHVFYEFFREMFPGSSGKFVLVERSECGIGRGRGVRELILTLVLV